MTRSVWICLSALVCAGNLGCSLTGNQVKDYASNTGKYLANPFAKQVVDHTNPKAQAKEKEGRKAFEEALPLFEQKEYEQAESKFRSLSKKYEGYYVEEDCLFMLAECQYRQERFPPAQDTYSKLLKRFPSSRFLDQSTQRLFSIATIWLNEDGSPKSDELLQVSYEEVTDPLRRESAQPQTWSFPINFFDRTKPIMDKTGRALEALETVWLNDPTGPLADDSLMLAAAHYIRQGEFREADEKLQIIRTEYAKSEHAERAFVLGSTIKLANYQGPLYDRRDLDDAEDLARSTLNLFPNHPETNRLRKEVADIRDRQAERDWALVKLYERKGRPKAVMIYCEEIIRNFPNSKQAELAKQKLAELEPRYQSLLAEKPEKNQEQGIDVTEDPGRVSIKD